MTGVVRESDEPDAKNDVREVYSVAGHTCSRFSRVWLSLGYIVPMAT